MAEVIINVTRDDQLDKFPEIFQQVARPNMTVTLEQLTALAQLLAPQGVTGIFKGSITNSGAEFPEPMTVTGSVFSTDDPIKVQVIEGVDAQGNERQWGRDPGKPWPPVNVITLWVSKKLGISDPRQLRAAVFFIRRKIGKEGIPAVRPFKQAHSMKEPEILRVFTEVVPAKIAEKL